jgi:hypothetical protein
MIFQLHFITLLTGFVISNKSHKARIIQNGRQKCQYLDFGLRTKYFNPNILYEK